MARRNAQFVLAAAFWVAVFGLALWLNVATPPWGDDWWRAEKPSNFLHVFTRIGEEYTSWTGRSSTLLLTFLVMLRYPGAEWVFDGLNALMWAASVLVLFRCATGRLPRTSMADTATLFLAFAGLFLLTHSLGEVALWTTGAVAYLWPIVAACWLMRGMLEWATSPRQDAHPQASKTLLLGSFFTAAFVANTLENLGASLLGLSLFLLLWGRLRGLALSRQHLCLSGGFLAGFAALALAPGNYKRYSAQDDGQPVWLRFPDLLERIWRVEWAETHALVVLAMLAIAVALLRPRSTHAPLVMWLVFAAMLALTMIGSTGVTYGQRTAFVAEFALLIVIVGLIHRLAEHASNNPQHGTWLLPAVTVSGIVLLSSITTVVVQAQAIQQQHRERIELMQAYAHAGLRRIFLPSLQVPYRRSIVDDLVDGPLFLRDIHGDMPGNAWRNSTYATYYGFEFALRLPQTQLLFLPQLEDPTTGYTPRASSAEHAIWTRQRKDKLRVDVLIPGGVCSDTALTYESDGSRQDIGWSQHTQLAVIDATGLDRTRNYCAMRAELPADAASLSVRRGGRTVIAESTDNP